MMAFDTRERLDRYLAALQAVIDRHDILRTAIQWEGLPEPVQVVWRQAPLSVEEVELSGGDAPSELRERFDPRQYRLDVRRAPLQRAFVAFDRENKRWLLWLLSHHLVIDHTALEVVFAEVRSHLLGDEGRLIEPVPFRQLRGALTSQVSGQRARPVLPGRCSRTSRSRRRLSGCWTF